MAAIKGGRQRLGEQMMWQDGRTEAGSQLGEMSWRSPGCSPGWAAGALEHEIRV